ncbi:MAG: mechanosensitive ion channel family protein [Candidatus Thermoplasmatota archaeon]
MIDAVYNFLLVYGPFIIVSTLFVLLILFLFPHISRYSHYLKLRQDPYLEDETLDLTFNILKFMLAIFAAVSVLYLGVVTRLPYINLYFEFVQEFGIALLLFFLTIFLALLIAKMTTRYIAVRKERSMSDPNSYLAPGILEFYEISLKYFIFAIGIILALLVLVGTIRNPVWKSEIIDLLGISRLDITAVRGSFMVFVLLMVILYLAGKLLQILLEDFKKKTKKFPPRLVDLIKALIRYAIYWVAVMITITVILQIAGFAYVELVVAIMILMTLLVFVALAFSPMARDGLVGVTLFITDSVNAGDWLILENGVEGEVLAQHLLVTRVRRNDGTIIDVPNTRMLSGPIVNLSRAGSRLVEFSLELPLASIDEAIRAVEKAVSSLPQNIRPPKVSLLDLHGEKVGCRVAFHIPPSEDPDLARTQALRQALGALSSPPSS